MDATRAGWSRLPNAYRSESVRRYFLEVPEELEWVTIDHAHVPRRFAVAVHDARFPLRIEAVIENRRAVCVAITPLEGSVPVVAGDGQRPRRISAPPLTTKSLRLLPLKHLLRAAERELVLERREIPFMGGSPETRLAWAPVARREGGPEELARLLKLPAAERKPGDILADRHLAEVARIYQEALEEGLPPTRTTWERLQRRGKGPSRATVARWVMLARQKGLLPQTEPRRARGWRPPGKENDG